MSNQSNEKNNKKSLLNASIFERYRVIAEGEDEEKVLSGSSDLNKNEESGGESGIDTEGEDNKEVTLDPDNNPDNNPDSKIEEEGNPEDNNNIPTSSLFAVHSTMNIYRIDIDKLFDAPADWNFFPPLQDVKFEELINSISENGLLVPLIVWDQGDGRYMVLSGHNRKRAYAELFKRTGDEKYKGIYCTVKIKDEIDDEDAKTIIIDTNFVQRDLSPSLRSKCIIEKYRSLGRKKRHSNAKGPADVISEEYKIGRSMVFVYYKLRNLIPELMRLIDENIISIKAGAVLSDLPQELQIKLVNQYALYLTNKRILNINTNSSEEEIIETLTKTDREYIKVINTIPKEKYDEFIEYVDLWLKKQLTS